MDSPAIYVGKDVFPGAFAWVVPLGDGVARVGLMTGGDSRYYFSDASNNDHGVRSIFLTLP